MNKLFITICLTATSFINLAQTNDIAIKANVVYGQIR